MSDLSDLKLADLDKRIKDSQDNRLCVQMIESFFEIPSTDFRRAVKFYETIFNIKLSLFESETESMACFPEEKGFAPGAIIFAEVYKPAMGKGESGIHLSPNVDDIDKTLVVVEQNGGKTICPKAKIYAEGRGYFAVINDSEGDVLGLYSDK